MDTEAQTSWPFPQPAAVDIQRMFLALPHMQAAGMRAALAEQREMLSFAKHRCDQDLALAQQLVDADDVKGLYEAFLRFCEGAAKDYVAELTRASRIGSRVASIATTEIRHEAEQLVKQPVSQKMAA